MIIDISNFPEFDDLPDKGITNHSDSMVNEIEFEKDSIIYFAKVYTEVKYNRYYEPGDWESPGEDTIDITYLSLDPFKIYKYIDGDEIELKDKEFKRIKKYIIENTEVL